MSPTLGDKGLPDEIVISGQVENSASSSKPTDLVSQVVLFGRLLRETGVKATSSNLIDLFQSLGHIDISNKEDFYWAARANLVASRGEIEAFDRAFDAFWSYPRRLELLPKRDNGGKGGTLKNLPFESLSVLRQTNLESWGRDGDRLGERESIGYSPDEILSKRDLGKLTEEEVEKAQKAIVKLASIVAAALSRRRRSVKRGREVDFRRTFRKNILYGSDPVLLARKGRKLKKTRLILLCDVSGSMKLYSRFLLQFIYGLQRGVRDVEVAVFSTRLTVITRLLKSHGVEKSLKEVADSVHDWAGGTDIGRCLRDFNRDFGRVLVGGKSVVMIISDGWDRGSSEVLKSQMESLRQRAYRLIWLNPLLGSPAYQPLCQGIRVALPYLDYFLPAHNLESLALLAQKIRKVWR